MHESYVTDSFYLNIYKGTSIPENELEKYLRQASRHIDILTYSRIIGKNFSKLTIFQQEIIQEVVCLQAEFEYENKEIFDMILHEYSINGVSMNFQDNSWNVKVEKGIPIRRDVYEMLMQTGLCCRLVR